GAGGARRAGLYRGRPLENDGQAHPHPAAHRRALPRANGAAPRGRVLFALISAHGALEIAAVLIGGRPWALRAQPPSSIEKSWYSHRAAVGAAGVCDSTCGVLGGSGKRRVRSTRVP